MIKVFHSLAALAASKPRTPEPDAATHKSVSKQWQTKMAEMRAIRLEREHNISHTYYSCPVHFIV